MADRRITGTVNAENSGPHRLTMNAIGAHRPGAFLWQPSYIQRHRHHRSCDVGRHCARPAACLATAVCSRNGQALPGTAARTTSPSRASSP